jgi:Zn-dependent M28 family amino/carboxypeptidase
LLPPISPLPVPDLAFSGDRAFAHLEAYMQFQPRNTGSPGWQRAGDYIIQQMQSLGWQIEEQRFDYKGVGVRNIIAKRGSGPVLIVGAHYDGRKYADKDPDPAKQRDPMPGANDGGSGVAILLELARHVDPAQLGREVWITFFDAEDNGNLEGWEYAVGSAYMAENLTVRPEAMVLLDLVGDADLQIFYEQTSTAALSESIWQTASELGYNQFVPQVKYSIIDDHTAFLEAGIPAVDIIDFDYPHWDTTNDTLDKVSGSSLEVVGRTVERWLETRAKP